MTLDFLNDQIWTHCSGGCLRTAAAAAACAAGGGCSVEWGFSCKSAPPPPGSDSFPAEKTQTDFNIRSENITVQMRHTCERGASFHDSSLKYHSIFVIEKIR